MANQIDRCRIQLRRNREFPSPICHSFGKFHTRIYHVKGHIDMHLRYGYHLFRAIEITQITKNIHRQFASFTIFTGKHTLLGLIQVHSVSIRFVFRVFSRCPAYAQSKTTWQASSWRLQEMDWLSALTPTPKIPMRFNSKVWVKDRLASSNACRNAWLLKRLRSG